MGKFQVDEQTKSKIDQRPFKGKCKANGCPRHASVIDGFFDDGRPKHGLCLHHAKYNFSHWDQVTLRIRKLKPVFDVWDRLRAPGSFGLSVVDLSVMEIANILLS